MMFLFILSCDFLDSRAPCVGKKKYAINWIPPMVKVNVDIQRVNNAVKHGDIAFEWGSIKGLKDWQSILIVFRISNMISHS